MRIPKFLFNELDATERKMAEDFIKECNIPLEAYEEDCCMSAPYHYEIHPSGIGDNIHIVYGDKRLALLSDERIESL